MKMMVRHVSGLSVLPGQSACELCGYRTIEQQDQDRSGVPADGGGQVTFNPVPMGLMVSGAAAQRRNWPCCFPAGEAHATIPVHATDVAADSENAAEATMNGTAVHQPPDDSDSEESMSEEEEDGTQTKALEDEASAA